MVDEQTWIYILDEPSLARRALETQLTMQSSGQFGVKAFDSISGIEHKLDFTVEAIFIDIFRFPSQEVTNFIGGVRNAYPWIVFVLWIAEGDYPQKLKAMPDEWQRRFQHYFSLYKNYSAARFRADISSAIRLIENDYGRYMSDPDIRALVTAKTSAAAPELPPLTHNQLSAISSKNALEERVFISYARADTSFVDWLWQQLEAHAIRTWMDRKDIKPGEVWDDKINEALHRCAGMVLVLSPDSIQSKNVPKEWKFFMDTLNRPLIPLLWRDCTPHFQLVHLQHVDFRDYRSGAIDELVAVLKTLMKHG